MLMCDETARLFGVKVPLLYIQVRQDRLVGNSSYEAILRVKSGVSLATIEGPHLIVQCEPEAVADALSTFLKGSGANNEAEGGTLMIWMNWAESDQGESREGSVCRATFRPGCDHPVVCAGTCVTNSAFVTWLR